MDPPRISLETDPTTPIIRPFVCTSKGEPCGPCGLSDTPELQNNIFSTCNTLMRRLKRSPGSQRPCRATPPAESSPSGGLRRRRSLRGRLLNSERGGGRGRGLARPLVELLKTHASDS